MAYIQFKITPRNLGRSLNSIKNYIKDVKKECGNTARSLLTNTGLPVAQSVITFNTSGRSAHNDRNGLAQNLKVQQTKDKKNHIGYKLGVSRAWTQANKPDAALHIEYGFRPHFIKIRGNKSFQQWAIYNGMIVSNGQILRYRRKGEYSWFSPSNYWPVGFAENAKAAKWPPSGLRFMERAYAETVNVSNKELEKLKTKIAKKWRK